MSVSSSKDNLNERTIRYPKLMIHESKSVVVLFNSLLSGTVVWNYKNFTRIGEYCDNWKAGEFVDFNGKISLENE